MERKRIIIVLSVLILGIGLILILSNSKEEEKLEDNSFDPNAWKNYVEKISVEEGKDGWYYYFLVYTFDEVNGKTHNFFDGCNLKYETLDDYNVIAYENGEIAYKVPTEPTLSISEKSTDGVMERDEVVDINDYFDNKQFNKEITLNDLSDLRLYNFKKSNILSLYNNAMALDYKGDIPIETNLSDCNYNSEDIKEDNIKVIVGTIYARTGFKVVRMDIKYSDGTYLRDLVDNNKASKEQQEIYDNFIKMEEYIIENNKLDLREQFGFEGLIYESIYKITEGFLEL